MKYTDDDMRMMAIGEIGADFMAILLGTVAWMCLGDASILIKIPVVAVVWITIDWLALGFVHLGYNPDDEEDLQ